MASMTEGCSVCGSRFEVQFRYQRSARGGAAVYLCSRACQAKSVTDTASGPAEGVVCDGCGTSFVAELVSQVLHLGGIRRYACSSACRTQVLTEGGAARAPAYAAYSGDAEVSPVQRGVVPAATQDPALAAETSSAVRATAPRKRLHAPRRLAVFNHKGGTGKTTTTVSLASGLARRGYRVLVVDTDAQGNVAVSFDVKPARSLYHVLVMGLSPVEAVVQVRPNLDLLASNETLAAAELYLAGRQNRDRVLRERLASLSDAYDVVMLDCSPSLSLMNQNALVFAEGILVPVACDFLSLVGVRQVVKTVKNVNSLLHHPVQICGVLPTFYDARARICREAVDTLKQHFGAVCLEPIRSTIKVKEAPAQGKTLLEYASDASAAQDYERVVDWLERGSSAKGTAGFDVSSGGARPEALAG